MGVNIFCENTPICQGFQNTVCAFLIGNESSRIAVYGTFFFLNQFSVMVIHNGVLARMFGWQCPLRTKLLRTKFIKNVRFPNCREDQVNGDYTQTKKLKLQYKVAARFPSDECSF